MFTNLDFATIMTALQNVNLTAMIGTPIASIGAFWAARRLIGLVRSLGIR